MINLKKKVQQKMKSSYWSRGAGYFNKGYVGVVSIKDIGDEIKFTAEIEGSYEDFYSASVSVNKINNTARYNCDCYAFETNTGCKHIGALARKIEKEYSIDDNYDVYDSETGEFILCQEGVGNSLIENSQREEKEIFEKVMQDPDMMRHFMLQQGLEVGHLPDNILSSIFQEMMMKSGVGIANHAEKTKESSKLQIFQQLEKNSFVENAAIKKQEEERLYIWKLNFPLLSYSSEEKDLELCLYKGKILKNGNLSKGKQVYRKNIRTFPKKIQEYGQFIESSGGSYYGYNETRHITYLESPEFFMKSLFSIKEDILKRESNKRVTVFSELLSLKILTQKDKENNYVISLCLESNNKNDEKQKQIILKKYKIIGKKDGDYFAGLSKKNKLYFFKTDLPFDFITQLNEEKLQLNKKEFEQLKKSNYFSEILKHSSNIENLGLEKISGIPKVKIIVEIDENFEKVQVHKIADYGEGKQVTQKNNAESNFFVSADNIITQRNKEAERIAFEIFQELEKLGDNSLSIEGFSPLDASESLNFSSLFKTVGEEDDSVDAFFDEIENLITNGVQVEYKQETKRVSSSKLGMSVSVKSGVDFFDTKTILTLGDKELEEYAEFLNLLGSGKNKKSVTLQNGMTVLIKNDLEESFGMLEELGVDKKDIGKNIEISKYNIGLLQEKRFKKDLIDFTLDSETAKLKNSLSNFHGIRKTKLPDNITATLRDYQQVGFNWMNFLEKYNFSGILADDMGLGKTLQALAVFQKVYNKTSSKTPSLVVCPTSLVYNWLDEAGKFTPDLKVENILNSKIGFDEIKKDTQVIIGSYGIIANLANAGKIPKKLYYLVLDESQNIKNPAAKRTKSICKIRAKYRLALSGTPIENNLMELWSGFNFLMPGFLGTLGKFKSKYMGTKSTKHTLQTLSEKVKPFILRRTKEEVLKELPPKQEEIIKLEMLPKQKAFYSKMKNAFKLQITKELEQQGLNKARFKVLDSLLKLRQACLTPELVAMKTDAPKESIKLQYIEENIEDMITSGHNLLIFSQFTGFLKYVRNILEKREIDYNYIDGKVKSKDRKALVDEFNSGKKNVFVISLKAGGTGLNLTKADYVLHLDPWWNPAVENQATDRAHRMGQKKTVFVKKLICKDSIEEKILELQEKKKKLIDDVFSGNFSGSLSQADIDFIFE